MNILINVAPVNGVISSNGDFVSFSILDRYQSFHGGLELITTFERASRGWMKKNRNGVEVSGG